MSTKRSGWGPNHHPSYNAKLPEPMVVVLREEDGSILESSEVSTFAWELTQELLAMAFGQYLVHKGSYIEVRPEEDR